MKLRHIEVEGCIVNIREDLIDRKGRKFTTVQIIPDRYAGEPSWKLQGAAINRVVR